MNYYRKEKNSYTLQIFVMLVLVASFFAYSYFANHFVNAQTEPLLTSTANNDSPFSTVQLALLAKIQSIKLDGEFFKNPVFVSLQDWTIALGQEDAGRPNPFAPVEGMAQTKPTTPTATPAKPKLPAIR